MILFGYYYISTYIFKNINNIVIFNNVIKTDVLKYFISI